jgi:ACS family hexuronate transporter-like MFS transporter
LVRKGVSVTVARKGVVFLFAFLMTSAIPAVLVADARVSVALISLAMFGYTGCNANMLAFPGDVFPRSVLGSIWGLASMGSGFGGMVFATITGWAIDHYSYVPVFIGFGIMPLLSATMMWLFLGPLEPASAPLSRS